MKSGKYFSYFFCLFLTSCVIVNTPGFYSGYKKLSPEQKQTIAFVDGQENKPLCSMDKPATLYAITAKQLQGCLNENLASVVYFWSPHCHAKSCISLGAAENYCLRHNYKLFIVAEYYDMEQLQLQTNVQPVFFINHIYYKTDYCNKYIRLFTNELLENQHVNKEQKQKRFLFFNGSKFTEARDSLF